MSDGTGQAARGHQHPTWLVAMVMLLLTALPGRAVAVDDAAQQQRLARALRELDVCLAELHGARRAHLGPLGFQGQLSAAPTDRGELAELLGQRVMLLDTALRSLQAADAAARVACRHTLEGPSLSVACRHGEVPPDGLRLTNTGALPLRWPTSTLLTAPSRDDLDHSLRALLSDTTDDIQRARRLLGLIDERLGPVASGAAHDELSLTVPALALLAAGRPLGCRDRARLLGALGLEVGLPARALDEGGHGVVRMSGDGGEVVLLPVHERADDAPEAPTVSVPIDEWARPWEGPTPLLPGQSLTLSRSAHGPRFRPDGPLLDGLEGHGIWRADAPLAGWRDGLSVCLPGPLVSGVVAGTGLAAAGWHLEGRLADGPWRALKWTHRDGKRDLAGLAGWLPNGSGLPVQRVSLRLVPRGPEPLAADDTVSVELHFAHDPGLVERVLAAPGWSADGAQARAEWELFRSP